MATAGQTVAEALAQSGAESLRQLPVVEIRDGRRAPIGVLSRSDVVAAYLRARDRHSQLTQQRRAISQHDDSRHLTAVEIVVASGSDLIGKTLAEIAMPTDSIITSIHRNGTSLIPRGLTRIAAGDRLALLASEERRAELIALLAATAGEPAPI